MIYRYATRPLAHQRLAFHRYRDVPAFALNAEQGTGKTKIVIDKAAWLWRKGELDLVVVFSNKGSYLNWESDELPKHMPIPSKVYIWDRGLVEGVHVTTSNLAVLLVNIEALSQDRKRNLEKLIAGYLRACRALIVVDEASSIKSHRARCSTAVYRLGKLAVHRVTMTGTPITKSPLDLFGQYRFLDPTLLGTKYEKFKKRYAVLQRKKIWRTGKFYDKIIGYQRQEELFRIIRPITFRVTKDECLDLPDKIYERRMFHLSDAQQSLYNQMKRRGMAKYKGRLASCTNAMTKLLRLHQIALGYFVDDDGDLFTIPNERLRILSDIIDTVESEKIIIWCPYIDQALRPVAQSLRMRYSGQGVIDYHGETTDRGKKIAAFRKDPSCRFLVANQSVGGYSLTLTECDTSIYYTNTYNLVHRLQSEDRTHRIGQTRHAMYLDIVAKGTVEVKVLRALRNKIDLAQTVLNDDQSFEHWLNEPDDDDG